MTPQLGTAAERFEILQHLGTGSFGGVYAAWDRVQDRRVALKLLRRVAPEALARFKNEFRSLTGLHHPNLVTLYEFFAQADEGRWFFTMEYVDGQPLLHVTEATSSSGGSAAAPTVDSAPGSFGLDDTWTDDPGPVGVGEGSPVDETVDSLQRAPQPGSGQALSRESAGASGPQPRRRPPGLLATDVIRHRFRQVAEAIAALHASGHLHRDIKPSNVLVTPREQVYVLDFGLIVELSGEGELATAGTPLYLAPELVGGGQGQESADWYSLGVMLYEALVGVPPFDSTHEDVLYAKAWRDAPDPQDLAGDAPADLLELCRGLLRRRPEERPSGKEVLAVLGGQLPGASRSRFIGRAEELATLQGQLTRRPAIAMVSGVSGLGKSQLVEHFLAGVRASRPDAIVAQGRCYERESVPFKALDGVIDSLSGALLRMPLSEVPAPEGIEYLAHQFPVLQRARNIRLAVEERPRNLVGNQARAAGAHALRSLLAALAERHLLVLAIDDIQWGDADSAGLLVRLLRAPQPPGLLLVTTHRTEGSQAVVAEALRGLADELEVQDIQLRPLSDTEARELVRGIRGPDATSDVVRQIVREAEGHPHFLDSLARSPAADATSLGAVIQAQVGQLAPADRQLVELCAVLGRPVAHRLARRAVGLVGRYHEAVLRLAVGRLVRTDGTGDEDLVEIFHDRIRETVNGSLSEQARIGYHVVLADLLADHPDPELRMVHERGAGRFEAAAQSALEAATSAARALAFGHAADLYATALDLGRFEPEQARGIQKLRAEALKSASRGREAAEAYLAAAEGLAEDERGPLLLAAADQYVNSGHFHAGQRHLGALLAGLGEPIAGSPARALASLVWHRVKLAFMSWDFEPRPEREVDPRLLLAVDSCYSTATSFSVIDTVRGADFQMRQLYLALKSREPKRVALGLCLEAIFAMTLGPPHLPRAERALGRAAVLATDLADPHARLMIEFVSGMRHFMTGGYGEGVEPLAVAEAKLRQTCPDATWERSSARIFRMDCMRWAGRWAESARLLPGYIDEAAEANDLHLLTYTTFDWMAAVAPVTGQVEEGRRRLGEVMLRWEGAGYLVQHWWSLWGNTQLDNYLGEHDRALARLDEQQKGVNSSLATRVAVVRSVHFHAVGATLCGVAATCGPAERKPLLGRIRACIKKIDKTRCYSVAGFSNQLRAGVAGLSGDEAGCVEYLREAEQGYGSVGMAGFQAAMARALGARLGGDEGAALVRRAEGVLQAEGVVQPECVFRMLAPGL